LRVSSLPVLMVLVSCAGTPVIRSADSTAASSSVSRDSPGADGLAGIYSEYFPIGAAVNSATITSARDMLSNEFSMLTAENEMKPSIIHPRYGTWHFYAADEIADYARKHGMTMRGHCFVWHSQTPGWFFSSFGELAGAELLWERLGEHIGVMAERYGDVVEVWDVANEVISDDRGEFLRPSPYLDILGDDYVAQSFLLARQILPDARLFYNDYSVLDPVKQDKIFRLLEDMLDRGIPVDGIGIQGHWNIYQEDLAERLDRAIVRFAGLGLEVQVTEMGSIDVSARGYRDPIFVSAAGAPRTSGPTLC
jgi:endo-1,4-beta-xylanase